MLGLVTHNKLESHDLSCVNSTVLHSARTHARRCGNYFVTRYKLKEEYIRSKDSKDTTDESKEHMKQVASAHDLSENVLEDDIDEHPVESVIPGMSRSVRIQRKGKELFWNIVRGGS